jgi:hypothetical protein
MPTSARIFRFPTRRIDLATSASAGSARSRRYPAYVLAALATLSLVRWLWSPGGEAGAVRELPATERHALYQRTLLTLQSPSCDPAHSGLKDYCREQAEFIIKFRECDAACGELAKRFLLGGRAR